MSLIFYFWKTKFSVIRLDSRKSNTVKFMLNTDPTTWPFVRCNELTFFEKNIIEKNCLGSGGWSLSIHFESCTFWELLSWINYFWDGKVKLTRQKKWTILEGFFEPWKRVRFWLPNFTFSVSFGSESTQSTFPDSLTEFIWKNIMSSLDPT